jgi:hypothetical protein
MVHDGRRRRGIATALLDALIDQTENWQGSHPL